MAKDILTDSDGDLSIVNGDFEISNSDEQHIEHILSSSKGHYKQHPIIGVGIEGFFNSPSSLITRQKLEKEITLQLEYDGAKEIEVSVNDTIKVAAVYE